MDAIEGTLLLLVASNVLWTIFMHICTWAYFAGRDDSDSRTLHEPGVSIVKPTKGVDQSAFENFCSFCLQEYAGDYELLFCVEELTDPAVPVIRRVMAEYPDKRVRLIFSESADSRSFGKLKNMIAGVAASSYDVIVFSDSDARVPPTFLRDTVACTRDPGLGIAFGAPAYAGSDDWPAALTSISVNELVPRIATLHVLGLFDGAIGTTMVARRDVIEELGGLEQLGWHIADDIQLARMIRRRGYRIHRLVDTPTPLVGDHPSLLAGPLHTHEPGGSRPLVESRVPGNRTGLERQCPDCAGCGPRGADHGVDLCRSRQHRTRSQPEAMAIHLGRPDPGTVSLAVGRAQPLHQ
jgi:ceramide glucosyltransferase